VRRERIRKAKVQMELNLARHVKNNKNGFYRYIGRRSQAKESVPPLINEDGELLLLVNTMMKQSLHY